MWGIPWHNVVDSFRSANYQLLPVYVVLLATFYAIKAWRWRLLLTPVKSLHTRDVVPSMMIGFMGNNLLPFHLGEFLRVYVMGRQYSVSKTAVLSTVVLERVFDIVAILCLLGIGVVSAPGIPDSLQAASIAIAAVLAAAVVMVVLYVLFTRQFVATTIAVLRAIRVPPGVRDKLQDMLESGAAGLAAIRSVRLLVLITLSSFAQWLVNGMLIWISLYSFGVEVSYSAALLVLGVTALGVTVPSTPGFFGVIQICFKVSLKPFGVDMAAVFAASIYYHLVQYILVTGTGLICLSRLGLRLGDLKREADKAEEDSHQPAKPEADADARLSEVEVSAVDA